MELTVWWEKPGWVMEGEKGGVNKEDNCSEGSRGGGQS